MCRPPRIAVSVAIVFGLAVAPAFGDVDMTGTWLVSFNTAPPGQSTFVQTGTTLTAAFAGGVAFAGSVDPATGVFALSLSALPPGLFICSAQFDGMATADSNSLSGTLSYVEFTCTTPTMGCGCNSPHVESAAGMRCPVCTPVTCGNGIVEGGEQCDDGNSVGGDCCSALCQPETGLPCASDGVACTEDRCNANAQCVHGPYAGCRTPSRGAAFALKPLRRGGARLRWQWRDDQLATGVTDFGDPTADTDLRLCVFAGPAATLVLDADAPPAPPCGAPPCWTAHPTGFDYRSPTSAPGGLGRVKLRAGIGSRSFLQVKGSGPAVALLAPLGATPLRTQLLATDADGQRCWEAAFDE